LEKGEAIVRGEEKVKERGVQGPRAQVRMKERHFDLRPLELKFSQEVRGECRRAEGACLSK